MQGIMQALSRFSPVRVPPFAVTGPACSLINGKPYICNVSPWPIGFLTSMVCYRFASCCVISVIV